MRKSLTAVFVAVLVVALVMATTQVSAVAQSSGYDDPVTEVAITRLTDDGAQGCTNYMGNQSGESTSWSPDSQRITYAKWCETDSARTGVYVYDLATDTHTCVARADKHWANPIFDHDGDTVWFIDGSDSERNEANKRPYVIRSVAAPRPLAANSSCPDAATTRVDIQQASGNQADDVLVMTKNARSDATSPLEELFATHVRSGGQWRTIVFNSGGQLQTGWDFDDDANPRHGDYNDGDASIWSPVDPRLIFTNRGTSATNDTVQRGVFTVDANPQLRFEPFPFSTDCSGSYQTPDTVAHSDWIWHRANGGTDIFASSDRCVYLRDASGQSTIGPWKLFGYLHINFDRASTTGDLGDIRLVADEYFDGSGSEPFLYTPSLTDLGLSDGDGLGDWQSVRSDRKLVGHRNRMDTGSNDALKAFEPHPQFSPNGRWVLWQSSSLNQVLGYTCPQAECGPPGSGQDANTSFLDLYLADAAPAGGVIGDATCDNLVDNADVTAVLEYLVGTRSAASSCPLGDPSAQLNLARADRDGDGSVTISDALQLARCATLACR